MLIFFELVVVSIQSSHTSPSKCRCSSPFGNLMSCSLLTPWFCSLKCPSSSDVIYGISCLCSLGCLFCGDVICGTIVVYITTCTIVDIVFTTIGIVDGFILPLIIFCAFKYVLSYSLFILEPKVSPSSTLFLFLKTFLGESVVAFFLFSSAIYISSLVFLTLAQWFLWIVLVMHKQILKDFC